MTHLGTTKVEVKLEGIDKPIIWHNWNHPSTKGNENNLIEEYESARRNKLVPRGGTVVDIGAFTGDSALAYGLLAGKSGMVLAFEPNPAAFAVLKQNAHEHADRCYIEYYELAISDRPCRKTFNYSDPSFCNGGDPAAMGKMVESHKSLVEVSCTRLERFVNKLDRVDFIKIDAEGSDADILHSISAIVSHFKPVIKAEMYPALTPIQRMRFHHVLRSLGYDVFSDATGQPISTDEFLSPGGFFNFIARPI